MSRVVSFWIRLLRQPDARYSRRSYDMLKRLDEIGDDNWASAVRIILFQHGFAYAWINQILVIANRS